MEKKKLPFTFSTEIERLFYDTTEDTSVSHAAMSLLYPHSLWLLLCVKKFENLTKVRLAESQNNSHLCNAKTIHTNTQHIKQLTVLL